MEDAVTSSATQEATMKVEVDSTDPRLKKQPGNRKERRADAAIERRRKMRPAGAALSKRGMDGKHFRLTHVNWFERFVREMKGNKRVEKLILDGKLDKFLRQPE